MRAGSFGAARAAAPPPADTTGTYYVRVNVHFVQRADGTDNFGVVDLPATPRVDENGYRWAHGLIDGANSLYGWGGNPPMRLPVGNATPHPPKRVQLVLTGVYFDRVPAAQDAERLFSTRNMGGTYLYKTFGQDRLRAINIFVMNHADPAYASTGGIGSGIGPTPAEGCWLKIVAPWRATVAQPGLRVPWSYLSILNHELGHVLGLPHTYVKPWNPQARDADGFRDTPNNPNCWDDFAFDCACAEPMQQPASNNMMDYNNVQNALTPQQLARIYYNLGEPQAGLVAAYGGCAPAVAAFSLRAGSTPVDEGFGVEAGPLLLNGAPSFNETRFAITVQRLTRRGRPKGAAQVRVFDKPFERGRRADGPGTDEVVLAARGGWRAGRSYRIGLRVYSACGGADSVSRTVRVGRGLEWVTEGAERVTSRSERTRGDQKAPRDDQKASRGDQKASPSDQKAARGDQKAARGDQKASPSDQKAARGVQQAPRVRPNTVGTPEQKLP